MSPLPTHKLFRVSILLSCTHVSSKCTKIVTENNQFSKIPSPDHNIQMGHTVCARRDRFRSGTPVNFHLLSRHEAIVDLFCVHVHITRSQCLHWNKACIHDLVRFYFMLGLRHDEILQLLNTVDDIITGVPTLGQN